MGSAEPMPTGLPTVWEMKKFQEKLTIMILKLRNHRSQSKSFYKNWKFFEILYLLSIILHDNVANM